MLFVIAVITILSIVFLVMIYGVLTGKAVSIPYTNDDFGKNDIVHSPTYSHLSCNVHHNSSH